MFIPGNILVYRERKEFTISKVYQDDLVEGRDVGDVSKFINGETVTKCYNKVTGLKKWY